MNRETRSATAKLSAGDSQTVAGYAAVFNSPTVIAGEFVEVIAPGAFSAALASDQDVLALYSHELERLLGRRSAGTLRLSQDETGLAIEVDLPNTTDGRDVGELIRRGDLSGMSFGFSVLDQDWSYVGDMPTRTIKAVELYEVTITANPAYCDTSVAMRSLRQAREGEEAAKRSANFAAAQRRIARRIELDLRERKSR